MCFNTASKSSNKTTTQNIKKDVVIGNGSQGFSADNGASQTVNLLDGGAIKSALDYAGLSGANALTFADSASSNAMTLGTNALVSNASAVRDSLSFADSAVSNMTTNNANAFSYADSSMKKAAALGAGAFDLVAQGNAVAGTNYQNLLRTTSDSLNGILGGIASTQNFISGTQAQASGQMDNRTKMILGAVTIAAVAFVVINK